MDLSVILPVYNAQEYVKEAIESILSQTFEDFELIVINDGSNDRSLEIIEQFNDDRIHLINQTNQGLARSLNNGLNIAKGKFIARMDADDICSHKRFERQLEFLKRNPDVKLVGTAVELIDVNGNFVSYDIPYLGHSFLKKYLFKVGNPFKHPTIMMDREIALLFGGYNEKINKYFEDYFLWAKISTIGRIEIIPEILLKYRITPGSIMSSIKDKKFSDFMINIVNRGDFDEHDIIEMKSIKENSHFLIDSDKNKLYEMRIKSASSSKLGKIVKLLSTIFNVNIVIAFLGKVKSYYTDRKIKNINKIDR